MKHIIITSFVYGVDNIICVEGNRVILYIETDAGLILNVLYEPKYEIIGVDEI